MEKGDFKIPKMKIVDSADLVDEDAKAIEQEETTVQLPSYYGLEKGEKMPNLDNGILVWFDPLLQPTKQGQEDAQEMSDTCEAWLEAENGWLVLLGGYGIGKTHLMKYVAVKGNGYYMTAYDFDYRIKQFGDTSKENYVDPDEWLYTIGTMERRLIIDDVGAGYIDKGWTSKRFERLIDLRYRNNRPTAITSNLSLQALEKELGARVMSRICDADISRVVSATKAHDIRGIRRG